MKQMEEFLLDANEFVTTPHDAISIKIKSKRQYNRSTINNNKNLQISKHQIATKI